MPSTLFTSSEPVPGLPALTAGVGSSAADQGAAAYSRLVQRLRRRYADRLQLLPAGPPTRQTMQAALNALLAEGLVTGAALRVLRQIVLERLVVLDCQPSGPGPTPLSVVTLAMTELAELALDVAMNSTQQALDALYGAPLLPGSDTGRATLWVVGMGKLGARELNVSSDIDLIYV